MHQKYNWIVHRSAARCDSSGALPNERTSSVQRRLRKMFHRPTRRPAPEELTGGWHVRRHFQTSKLTREPVPPGLTPALDRNIEALLRRWSQEEAKASLQERIADAVTRFTGSMAFVYLHIAVFGFWIIANLNWLPGIPAWDESFVMLAMIASVEAIFLSTFVLISQNRMAAAADTRADLNLQISLLTEHELTKLVRLVSEIANRVGIPADSDPELREAQRDVKPEKVMDRIEARKEA